MHITTPDLIGVDTGGAAEGQRGHLFLAWAGKEGLEAGTVACD